MRITQEKMDDAFCTAMQRAIDAGEEKTPTAVSEQPGTRNPKTAGRRSDKTCQVGETSCDKP
jgi:hypothetical protein